MKILFVIVAVNFAVLALHYFFPSFFLATFANFVRDIKVLDISGARGASGLAAEPGFMGAISVFYVSIAFLLKDVYGICRQSKKLFFLS